MTCLNYLRLNTMYIIVLLNLTGIMYENLVKASAGDYDSFLINSDSTDALTTTVGPKKMTKKEAACEKDIRWNFLGVPEKININELSILQMRGAKEKKGTEIEYIKLSDLNKIDKKSKKGLYDKTQDVVVIIPGFRTSIKRNTPESVAKLIFTLKANVKDINIFVLDVGEHFSAKYTYEKCVLKVPIIGRYLGINLAKIRPRPQKKIHLIGIDIGASIAGIAGKFYENEKYRKISRISAINPATLCLKDFLTKDSANYVDVYIGSNLYDEENGKIGKVNYVIQNENEKSSCNRLVCATTKAVHYYTDSILKDNKKFKLMQCSTPSAPDEEPTNAEHHTTAGTSTSAAGTSSSTTPVIATNPVNIMPPSNFGGSPNVNARYSVKDLSHKDVPPPDKYGYLLNVNLKIEPDEEFQTVCAQNIEK